MKKLRELLHFSGRELLYLISGSFIFALGTHVFVQPANIAPGGVQGLALMAAYLWHLPVGLISFLLNLPLLVIAWREMSRKFVLRTGLTLALCSLLLDLVIAPYVPAYAGDRLMSSLYGGVLVGAGLALVFMAGCTTGGTDIIGFLIQKKWPHISLGRALMIVDGIILCLSVFVFGNLDAGLFGVIMLYVQTKLIDMMLYGADAGTKATIVTNKPQEIVDQIIKEMDRTATILKGRGGYTGEDAYMVVCTVRKPEFAQLKKIIRAIDEKAFVIVTETTQVYGEGFKDFSDDL